MHFWAASSTHTPIKAALHLLMSFSPSSSGRRIRFITSAHHNCWISVLFRDFIVIITSIICSNVRVFALQRHSITLIAPITS